MAYSIAGRLSGIKRLAIHTGRGSSVVPYRYIKANTSVLALSKALSINTLRMWYAMLFLVWFDDSSKTPVVDKIRAAIAAYVERFQARPNLVLVNVLDYMELADVRVRHERTIQPNTFWVGREDTTALPTI